jgi:sulfonate dioxygenase
VAERKVVAFRGQDFADLPINEALGFGGYFGRHHIHPTSGSPEGFPEVHLVHRGAGDRSAEEFFASRTSSVAWHSDVSYEQQPPGTTFLYILDKPETGGDTLFVDAAEAYNRLSPLFRERLHGLKATHSGIEQVNAAAARGSIKRREPVVNEHPIIRTHPATGEKALYVNPQCEFQYPLACVSYAMTNRVIQSRVTSSASRRRSPTRSSSSCTTIWPMVLISRPASSGRRVPLSSGITA